MFRFKKILTTSTLLTLLTAVFSLHAMENEKEFHSSIKRQISLHDEKSKKNENRYLNDNDTLISDLRDIFSGLYYTTSVVGYGSNSYSIFTFLSEYLGEDFLKAEPPPQDGSKKYKNLKTKCFIPDKNQYKIVEHYTNIPYLYQLQEDSVTIIALCKNKYIDFSKYPNKSTFNELQEENDYFTEQVKRLDNKIKKWKKRENNMTFKNKAKLVC